MSITSAAGRPDLRAEAESPGVHLMRRGAAAAAAALTVMTVTVAFAPGAAAAAQPPENASAARAVAALTADAPTAAVPDDFALTSGYRPTTVDGVLLNPGGDCSSPVPLPAEFDTACKAHDLGYDLLRYADRTGEPLGPWARQAIDAAFDRRMRAACDTRTGALARTGCFAMADIADTAVDLNSRRQHYGAPVAETPPIPGGWATAASGIGAAAAILTLIRRRRARAWLPSGIALADPSGWRIAHPREDLGLGRRLDVRTAGVRA